MKTPSDIFFEYLHSLGIANDVSNDIMASWEISTAKRCGEDSVLVAKKGPEIHILPLKAKYSISRANVISEIAPMIEKFGYATTKVPIAESDHKLREKLGFVKTWQDENYTYWAITELPYQRKKGVGKCQLSQSQPL